MPAKSRANTQGEQLPPTVLIMGDFTHEGLRAKIEALGFETKILNLKTTPKHWSRITSLLAEMNNQGALVASFGYLPTSTLLRISEEHYEGSIDALITELERTTSLMFLYEQNLEGTIEPLPWECADIQEVEYYAKMMVEFPEFESDFRHRAPELPTREDWFRLNEERVARAQRLIGRLSASKLELVPFSSRNEVTIRMFEVLENRERGVFLRLYVPHGRYQADQFQGFLELFARYFREVEKREFAIDTQRTRRGTTFIFKNRDDGETIGGLREAIKRFDEFISLAQLNPAQAESILTGGGMMLATARALIAKYSQAYRRLLLDARHELEQKQLLLAQRFENELIDDGVTPSLPSLQPDIPDHSSTS